MFKGWRRWLREASGHTRWRPRGTETFGVVGLEAQVPPIQGQGRRLHLISCLCGPFPQPIFACYGSPNQNPVQMFLTDPVVAGSWLAGGATLVTVLKQRTKKKHDRKTREVSLQREGRPGAVPGSFIFIRHGTTARGTGTGEKEALRVDRRPGQPVARKATRVDGEMGNTPNTDRGLMD